MALEFYVRGLGKGARLGIELAASHTPGLSSYHSSFIPGP